MLPTLASCFFLKVEEVGLMNKGYVWIITVVLTILSNSLDVDVISLMHGVLSVKPYVPNSNKLQNFTQRWRKLFRREHPNMDRFELSLHGLWAYDSAMALAMAVERSGIARSKFKKPISANNLTDLVAIGYSEMGPRLLQAIKKIKFQGLSGEFHLVDGQLQQSAFQIVNVIGKGEMKIGFWTRECGISKKLRSPINKNDTNDEEDLEAIIWPGRSGVIPKGWEIPTDVFKEIMDHALPYTVPYEFIPFETPDGEPAREYNDLVYQICLGKHDVVVGDVTILANRSNFVDFTLPFTESNVAMILRIHNDGRKNAWIFMKPLQMDLWLTIGVFFMFTGFVVWVLEHRVNKEFRGLPSKQVGMMFWGEVGQQLFKVCGNRVGFRGAGTDIELYSELNINVNSRKASTQCPNINDLRKNGEYVGYHNGTFFKVLLKSEEFNIIKSSNYRTFEQYDDALSKGSKNGGVAAIIHQLNSFLWVVEFDGECSCVVVQASIDCDEDLVALYALVVTSRIARVDVVVKESIGSIVAVTVADGCSSSLTVGDGWRIAIKGVGQVFVDGAAGFWDSLCKYSLFHGFKFVYSRNDSERVVAPCRSMNCTWFVKANLEKPSGMFRIKEFMNEHCCGADVLSTTSSRSSSGLIGRLFSETMRLTPSKRAVDVKKELKLEYGVDDQKLGELFTLSKTWNVVRSNDKLYEVHSDPFVSVDIGRCTCPCGEWQINSFSRVHGLCALKRSKRNLYDYVENYYFTQTYREAYSKCINHVPTIWKTADM
ncbi:hypothetical protein Vadar_029711 [Vaccinium darrowii]|uniref:Uncharacterized protein n=1 Tax=Vaccinium darrowii TaxID=229202 RepID=A0ACB7Z1E1_9ERIC|nr:hypothetical protein Vadar_029711 [Vaccinium darrowii]